MSAQLSEPSVQTEGSVSVQPETSHLPNPQADPVTTAGLPVPPSEAELVAYLRGPRRWPIVVQALAFTPILWSLAQFAANHIALYAFFAWIALQIVSMTIGLLTSVRRRSVTIRSHRALVDRFRARPAAASVDVFLPTCGEPLDVLRNTYRYVALINSTGSVRPHVLDDAGRREVESLAAEFGFDYLSRPNKGEMKKAGNMLYAFARTDADFILVLDADFVPRHDILDHLLPYFEDAEVGIVQSPQYFDTAKSMNWLERTAGATQELFYRWIQPSRDTMSAAICVGTSAIYRRDALDKNGGFAQIEHSEDVHTGVALAQHGYRIRYVPAVVTKGLCPDQAKGFLSQQYRWATGSLSLATNREFHRHPAMPLKRRLPYFTGFLYYLNSSLSTVVAMLPGGLMFWFFPGDVAVANYLPFVGALAVWLILLPWVCHARWRLEVLRVQAFYSYAYLIAVLDKISGRHEAWVPTGNARATNPTAKRALRAMRIGVTFNLGFTISGLIHLTIVSDPATVWPAYLFGALNTYVLGPLLWMPHVLTWRQALVAVLHATTQRLREVTRREGRISAS